MEKKKNGRRITLEDRLYFFFAAFFFFALAALGTILTSKL
jgi:hypothetical protein